MFRRHEHGVLLPAHLIERVANRGQEVGIGGQDGAVERELDHRLHPVDRRHLAFVVGRAPLGLGDVGGELHHLARSAGGIQHRVVAGLDPHLAPVPANPAELAGLELAASQRLPEGAVGSGVAFLRRHEHGVLLPAHLVERVANRGQEVGVGGQDGAVEGELDHRLHPVDGGDLALVVGGALPGFGDVGGELHHPVDPAAEALDRRVGRLQPDLAPVLGDAAELACLELAASQRVPEGAVGRRLTILCRHEQRMMPAVHLPGRVAHGRQEAVVAAQHRPVRLELDHRLRQLDCRGPRPRPMPTRHHPSRRSQDGGPVAGGR